MRHLLLLGASNTIRYSLVPLLKINKYDKLATSNLNYDIKVINNYITKNQYIHLCNLACCGIYLLYICI